MRSKKADISMNTIVAAVIAITVLLVVILIFTSNIRKPSNEIKGVSDSISLTECKGVDGITGKEYICKSSEQMCASGEVSTLRSKYCQDQKNGNDVCCVYPKKVEQVQSS